MYDGESLFTRMIVFCVSYVVALHSLNESSKYSFITSIRECLHKTQSTPFPKKSITSKVKTRAVVSERHYFSK